MLLGVVFLGLIAGVSASELNAASHPDLLVKNFSGSRIVSGQPAVDGQFPYMLFIRAVDRFGAVKGCGGSILHPRWALTNGACVLRLDYLIAQAGSVNINRPLVVLESRTVFTPPGYNPEMPISQPNDIALIGFNVDIPFNSFIQPIRLQRSADRDRNYDGVVMTTSGWGSTFTPSWTDQYIVYSENLNWVRQIGINNFACMLLHNSNYLVRNTVVCARAYNQTSEGICSGDGGVPLTILDTDHRLTQIGVASFVHSWGCDTGLPAGFTRPGYYQDWFTEVTGLNFDW